MPNEVEVTNVRMPFLSMIVLMLKWELAAFAAFIMILSGLLCLLIAFPELMRDFRSLFSWL